MFLKRALSAFLSIFVWVSFASAQPPIEAYGALPQIEEMQVSPDGTFVVYLQALEGQQFLVKYEIGSQSPEVLVNVTNIKARNVRFAGNDYVLLTASKTAKTFGFRDKYEFSAAFAFNLKERKIKQLLRNTSGLYPAQSGLGNIVAVDQDGEHVYMPAYSDRQGLQNPPNDLYKVKLSSGRGGRPLKGSNDTIDWIVSPTGELVAREHFNNKWNKHTIRSREDGKWRDLMVEESDRPVLSLNGITAEGDALVYSTRYEGQEFSGLYKMMLEDGEEIGPLFFQEGKDIHSILMDGNRVVFGVQYTGLYPSYEFFDEELTTEIAEIQSMLPSTAVFLDSWSNDWSKLLFLAEAGDFAGQFFLYDRATKQFSGLASSRPQIKGDQVAEVLTLKYKARDGLEIPAVVTLPLQTPTGATPSKQPTIVLPHGGPETYDSVEFDWMAQFFASRGYLVVQPNFRGSTGFGKAFRDAGRGEWGKKMQDDVTDGVKALIHSGWTDPNRICIVGWSYGGYAALAGGASTPELYKCIVAGGAVTDLPEMMSSEARDHGRNHWVYSYWSELIGDPRASKEHLKTISPRHNAENFQAPVLLIHGRDDTVVPEKQSDMMNRALKRADKDVTYLKQKDGDHWLLLEETRLEALKAMGDFVDEHLQ